MNPPGALDGCFLQRYMFPVGSKAMPCGVLSPMLGPNTVDTIPESGRKVVDLELVGAPLR